MAKVTSNAEGEAAVEAAEQNNTDGTCLEIAKKKFDNVLHKVFAAVMVFNVLHFLLCIGGLAAACYMARESRK